MSKNFLPTLEQLILRRQAEANPSQSYTASLLTNGIEKIAQKVGEEAVELVIEAVRGNHERFNEECADLLYHLIVLIVAQGSSLEKITAILESRHQHVHPE
jgi:phosphoribosyl-ATP pyrophosphohydrolase